MSEEPRSAPSGDFVQSLARGLAVIRAFDAEHAELTLSDVARRAGITRAAAGRFLRTLEQLGYVRASTGSATGSGSATGVGARFALTPRVLELGFSYLSAVSIPEVVQPHLERLSHEVDESVSAAVLDGADIVYVARVPTRRIMSVRITIGTRFPAYATSMGRVLLAEQPDAAVQALLTASAPQALTERTLTDAAALRAELARVREQGWALVDGELEPGLRSVAVPVRDRRGEVVAAVNVSTSATRDTVEHVLDAYLPRLQAAATAIDAELRLI
ncbi:IclR family transcriptional regulator domain-containing protein [Microbacterium yannicii]|uniref:IclR family transcriptional regulator domain-containing protein n=1 Tax=Microbacterium yannicii TaxID=671622 RepID=UPI0002F89233|nr:IclR family transcriptional regulator C-terminal domain-containing protein [Microbacterium yannicii]